MPSTDPFLWDVEQVVVDLCAPGATWTKDTAKLAEQIRNEQIDGETLLSFEHTCSRKELEECLDIRLARHKSALSRRVTDLRFASKEYQSWHRDFLRKTTLQPEDEEEQKKGDKPARDELVHTAKLNGDAEPRVQDVFAGAQLSSTVDTNGLAAPGILAAGKGLQTIRSSTENLQTDKSTSAPLADRAADLTARRPSLEAPPAKRQRLAPTIVSKLPATSNSSMTRLFPWDDQAPGAYIGDGKLEKDLILGPRRTISSKVENVNSTDFVSTVQNGLPPGRRIAVHRIMRRFLRHNGWKETLLKNGEVPIPVTPSETEDDIVDLDDLPSEWDEDTQREMEEEKQETEEWQMMQRFLPSDRVQSILDGEIQRMTARWRERKAGKLERKAYGIWTKARHHGTSIREILNARRLFVDYKERIQRLCARIVNQQWEIEQDVKAQAQSLEQTIEDQLYQRWVIDTLESRVQPPKPETIPRQTQPKAKRQYNPLDEVLTSSDEEDFIVPDDEDLPLDAMQGIEPTNVTPVKSEPLPFVDLTQSAGEKDSAYVDLTTPTKPKAMQLKLKLSAGDSKPPPIDSFESMEDICSVDRKHWEEQNDRWRLVIYMLGKLTFGRRADILARMKANTNEDVWKNSVLAFISNPVDDGAEIEESEAKTTNFDITRTFLSFVRCKVQKVTTLTPLHARSKKKLLTQGETMFASFCNFIRDAEPIFPQASQIYRTDDLVILPDLEDEEGFEEDDEDVVSQRTSSKPRKNAPKEIIQNRDAVDLRQRELARARDQEARRLKLRATLASSGSVSRDRSRLIINESKEENQSLLYINDEIGKTIKDYQVGGVRFLWNQIVLDPDVRQGCLLAHTMGLGKTMQVITFLVAVAEAAASSDPSLRSQVPEDLRHSQTLVLCPPGIVNNWIDELLKWAPSMVLGPLTQIDSTAKQYERMSILQTWADSGGVLVVGYSMMKQLANNEEAEKILLEKPNIVVADEAHMLKNPNSQTNRLCSRFATRSRIALTGSPLANNVEEYYSTISWVAPNFLGPLDEFREIYVREIETGFAADSLAWERRRALKMLHVLKDTVAPKVNRATIKSCLSRDLPPKSEFVISVPPTDLQRKLYELYLNGVRAMADGPVISMNGRPKASGTQLFGTVNDLATICNHPRCFHQKVLDVLDNPEGHQNFPVEIIPEVLRITKGTDNKEPSLSLKVQYLIKILDEARQVGDKVLVFSQSIYTLDYLDFLLKFQKRHISRLDGKTKIEQRQDKIRDFNTGNKEVYLISTTAGGVGLNIQGANRVVIFDSKWNPVSDQQAVGRSYRLGQRKHVFVYHLMVSGSFEEALQSQAVFKAQLAARVVDQKNPIAWGKRRAELMQHIKDVENKDLDAFKGKDVILDALIEKPPSPESRIKHIVSTDTFEEEDTDITLNEQEQREAQELVDMNQLRLTDPAEYERRRARQAVSQVSATANFSSVARVPDSISKATTVTTLSTPALPQPDDASLRVERPPDVGKHTSPENNSRTQPSTHEADAAASGV